MQTNPVAMAQPMAQPMVTGNARVDEAMRTAFETYDVDRSGTLTKDEAKQMVVGMNLGVSEQYVDGVWSVYDTDGNGTLDMQEFARFFGVLVKREAAQPMQPQMGMAVAQPIGQMQPQMMQPQMMQPQMMQQQMMQQQMALPQGIAELAAYGDLFIKQFEAISGFETANQYDILGVGGNGMQPVFFAGEQSECCQRNCCGSSRSFTMNICSAANPTRQLFRIERPWRCKPPVCCCYLQELTVTDPNGSLIGRLEQQYSCCASDMDIIVGSTVAYKIAGPCCVCDGPCWGDQEFFISTPQGVHINTPAGPARITKMGARDFEGVATEMFTDADNFGCTFPPEATPEAKAVLLAAVFMIEFRFFEDGGAASLTSLARSMKACCGSKLTPCDPPRPPPRPQPRAAQKEQRQIPGLASAATEEQAPPNQPELDAVFTKALALGLTDEACVATMRSRIEAGHFTAQHYLRMFSARISEHEAAGMPIFNPRSPWIKQTNGSRCFYYRDHKTHPSAYSLIQPDEGVKKTEPHRRNGMHETADAEFEKFFAMAKTFDERGIRDLPEAAPPQQPIALPAVGGPSPRWLAGMVAECRLTLKGHAEDDSAGRYCAWVQSAAFSPNSASIVTASADMTARVWDVATGECQLTLDDHKDWVNTAAFSCGDGALIVTACDDRKSRVWDAKTGECRLTIPCRDYKMKSAAFSPDGTTILTASGGNPFDYPEDEPYAQIWEVPSWKVGGSDATYPAEWQARVDTLCGRFPDADKNSVVAALLEHDGHAGRAASTLQFPNGVQTGATGFRNAFAAARTPPDSGKSVKFTLKGHSMEVLSAAFSPSGAHAVTASDDQTAKVWDMVSGRCELTLNGHTASVNTATFSSGDGAVIVTASDDGTAKIWDAKTGACHVSLKGHTDSVKSADLSQDGATVVTASDDMTARVWDAASGKCLCTLNGHTGPLTFAAFSPDGGAIVTASQDTTAKVWAPRAT